MDEPTNHLDLQSSESLCAALQSYDGTLVFVSHNRALVKNLATKIWNVENQMVDVYPGTLDEYLYAMAQRRVAVAATAGVGVGSPRGGSTTASPVNAVAAKISRDDEKNRKRREAEERTRRNQLLGPLQKQVATLEQRIAELENAQSKRSTELADPEVYADALRRNRLLKEFQDGVDKLDELTARWERVSSELQTAESSV